MVISEPPTLTHASALPLTGATTRAVSSERGQGQRVPTHTLAGIISLQ